MLVPNGISMLGLTNTIHFEYNFRGAINHFLRVHSNFRQIKPRVISMTFDLHDLCFSDLDQSGDLDPDGDQDNDSLFPIDLEGIHSWNCLHQR